MMKLSPAVLASIVAAVTLSGSRAVAATCDVTACTNAIQ